MRAHHPSSGADLHNNKTDLRWRREFLRAAGSSCALVKRGFFVPCIISFRDIPVQILWTRTFMCRYLNSRQSIFVFAVHMYLNGCVTDGLTLGGMNKDLTTSEQGKCDGYCTKLAGGFRYHLRFTTFWRKQCCVPHFRLSFGTCPKDQPGSSTGGQKP